jgi:hypothetical protein
MGRSAQAERPGGCERHGMDDAAVLSILAQADAAPSLPRLGGMARPDGVAIVSEQTYAFSAVDGRPLTRGSMPKPPALVLRLPLLRGLAKLGVSLAPMFSRRGTVRPLDRVVLLLALLAPLPLALVPDVYRGWALGASIVALLAFMLRGRTLRLHGAEHRAIAAAETRCLVDTWYGTAFAALLVPVSLLVDRAPLVPSTALAPVFVSLVALALTMELWLAAQRWLSTVGRVALLPGLALQRLTTREPRLADVRVALRAVAAVIAADRP